MADKVCKEGHGGMVIYSNERNCYVDTNTSM